MKWVVALIWLALAIAAESAITVTDRGVGSSNTSEAFTDMSPSGTIPINSKAILIIGAQNAAGASTKNFPNTVTDSVGNNWWKVDDFANVTTNQTEFATYYCYGLTTQLTSGNSVRITYTTANVTGKCWSFYQVDTAAGTTIFPVVPGGVNNNPYVTQGTTGTPTIGAAQDDYPAGSLCIGVDTRKSADTYTGDSDTTNGTWSTAQHTAAGTNNCLLTQWKVVTATGLQTFNPTLTSAVGSIAILRATEAPINTRGVVGTTGNGTTSYVMSLRRTLAANTFGVMCVSMENAGSGGAVKTAPSSITDSVGNTWTQRLTAIYDPGVAGAGAEIAAYTAPITTQVTPQDNITFTWDAAVTVTNKVITVQEFAPPGGYGPYTYIANGSTSAFTQPASAPSITTSSITSGDVVIGIAGSEGTATWVGDSDTSNGSWSQPIIESGNSAAAGQSICTQYKTVTATATQSYDPTQTAADTIIGWIQIRSSPNQSATNGFLMWLPN